jgi:hypothetical protein
MEIELKKNNYKEIYNEILSYIQIFISNMNNDVLQKMFIDKEFSDFTEKDHKKYLFKFFKTMIFCENSKFHNIISIHLINKNDLKENSYNIFQMIIDDINY